jgi:broad specificity phosphatase PhoE
MTTIVLARHGETEWSASGQHTSVTDIPLTERGREAARGLKERLAGREFALVLASPMARAQETARLAGFSPEVEPGLMEVDYGDYEGRTTPEIREARPGWTLWADGSPGGETVADAGARADRVLERALAAEGDVILFAHGHILRVLAARWIGLEAAHGANLKLDTATLSELGFERETRVLLRWNVPHRPGGDA